MKIKYVITGGIIVILLVVVCVVRVHVDSIVYFSFQGEVYDKDTRAPLQDVRVSFIDRGFDAQRSRQNYAQDVGGSDEQGKIDLTLGYIWGREMGLLSLKPQKTFEVILTKDGYESEKFTFHAEDLPRKEKWLVVLLDKVDLGTDSKE